MIILIPILSRFSWYLVRNVKYLKKKIEASDNLYSSHLGIIIYYPFRKVACFFKEDYLNPKTDIFSKFYCTCHHAYLGHPYLAENFCLAIMNHKKILFERVWLPPSDHLSSTEILLKLNSMTHKKFPESRAQIYPFSKDFFLSIKLGCFFTIGFIILIYIVRFCRAWL